MVDSTTAADEHEWRVVLLAFLRAQEDYLRAMKAPGACETSIRRAWLRLQAAELRRDDFRAGAREHVPTSRVGESA